jgi:hypothetical protein
LGRRLVSRQKIRGGKDQICFQNTSHGAMPWREKKKSNILFMNLLEHNYCDITSPADAPPYLKATSANAIFKFETIFFLLLITTLPTKTHTTIKTPHIKR